MRCPNCGTKKVRCTDEGLVINGYTCRKCFKTFEKFSKGSKNLASSLAVGVIVKVVTGGLV